MLLRPDDIVRAKNCEDFTFKIKWNSREYVLPPGKDTFVPAAAAFNWFGDPRATDGFQSVREPDGTHMYIVDRATEVRRLRIKYGAGLEGDESNFDGVAFPRIEIWTSDNERVYTVLDDPEGKTVSPALKTISEDEDLRALVAAQARQLEMMKEHLGLNDSDEKAAADETELPRDEELVDLS